MKNKYAVIDTESSGLFDFAKPADAEGQPRLANLAIITLEDDVTSDGTPYLKRLAESNFLIKPDGWEMHPEAEAVNGLSTAHLLAHGLPGAEAIAAYAELIDVGYIVVTFNAQFDTKIMRGEMRRAGVPDRFEQTPNICLMRASTSVCCVPKKSGKGFKFPKLSEACAFFKIEQAGAHSALGDAKAAVEIMIRLHELKQLPTPEVHYAKQPPAGKEGGAS